MTQPSRENVEVARPQRIVVFCDFCGKHQDFVESLIAGQRAHICNECIDIAQKVAAEQVAAKKAEGK